jgi:non-ribosomal peptide synthetase component F
MPGPPELPLLKQPRLLHKPKFSRRTGQVDAVCWLRLRQIAGAAGITPPCLLLAIYAQVLSRWSANRQFTLNVPRFDRRPVHPQVDQLVGEFASFTLVVCDFLKEVSLLERARSIQHQMWAALDHGAISGLTVVRELIRLRGRGGAIFPVVFTANPTLGAYKPEALPITATGEVAHAITQTPQVWLDFQAGERDRSLAFNWDSVDELFPPGMLDQANKDFHDLLRKLSDAGTSSGNFARMN